MNPRLAALLAVRDGKVKIATHGGRGGHSVRVEPREHTVAVGYLNRADLLIMPHGAGKITLSPRGKHALTRVQA